MAPRAVRAYWSVVLIALTVLTVYRGWVIVDQQLPLFVDEAQYWLWSRAPAWGYYSKPPMVAWVIRLFSGLGDSELAIRLGSLLLHAATAMLVCLLGQRMFGLRAGAAAAMLFISLPLVGFNSLFMTTDAPLFFFWGTATYGLWRALERNAAKDWLLTGTAAGLGMLSKYSMAFFAPSVVLALCLPAYRKQWRNPRLYLAALLALLLFLPNIVWNAGMEFVSFCHTMDISRLDQTLFHPGKLAAFLFGQFACMGPIAFFSLLAALVLPRVWGDPRLGFLAAFTLPFLLLMSLQALLARANLNWAAPAYFAGTLLVAACWIKAGRTRRWLVAVVLNLVLLSGFYHYHALTYATGIGLTKTTDPYARLLGWPEMGEAIGEVLRRYPGTWLVVPGRSEFALLSYYIRPHSEHIRIWNPEGRIRNHFHLVADLKNARGVSVIFASPQPVGEAVADRFALWSALGTVTVPLYPDHGLLLYLYRGERFKGYSP